MEARRTLREVEANGADLSAGQLYALHFAATGNRAFAERIARARLWAELKAGQTPEVVG